VVFNLTESLEGSDSGAVSIPALLDGLGVPYTGTRAAGLAIANDKCAAKRLMRRSGLPTAAWFPDGTGPTDFRPGRYIVKARFEHASLGIEDDALLDLADATAARTAVARRAARLGRPCFAERFIDGREFNLALLEGSDGVAVLPPAEIDFSAFPPGKPRLVGYSAKWHADSFDYHHTPRRFDFESGDAPLIDTLVDLALASFESFDLKGYARVDFRVGSDGPMILEVNANPCLAPDAGFAAALARAGIAYAAAIDHILTCALSER